VQFELHTPVPKTITPEPEPEKKSGKKKSGESGAEQEPSAKKTD